MNTSLQVFTDGASRGNPGPGAAAYVIQDNNGSVLHQSSEYVGNTTNNTAEYTALLHAVTWLVANTSQANIQFFSDSELMVKQLNGIYKIKEPHIQNIAQLIKAQLQNIGSWQLTHIPRSQNKLADQLCNQTLDAHKV